jgi:hypothetical protein
VGRRPLAKTVDDGNAVTFEPNMRFKTRLVAVVLGAAAGALVGPAPTLEQGFGVAFENGLPTDPSYFPIGVWVQSPSRASEYRAIGINLFIGLWQGPTEPQLAELARLGMPVIASQNDVALHSPNAKMIRGWMQDDEPDNAQPIAPDHWGPCIPASLVAQRSAAIKAKDPTRPVFINFGRGVADPNWGGRGSCAGDLAYYEQASSGADILSFDIYPIASGYGGQLDYPSRGVKRLREAARNAQRIWAIVETTHIESEARVTPVQLRSEALLALLEGANGLVYFADEWTGGFREDGLFRYPDIVKAVTDANALIQRLAPVLNSPTLDGRIASSGTISSTTMLKERDGDLYLFAGSTDSKSGSVSFTLSGLTAGRAELIGENRQVSVSNGVFSDNFGPYEVHIYQIRRSDRP